MSVARPATAPSMLEELRQKKPFSSRSQEAYLATFRTADDLRRQVAGVLDAYGITNQQYNVLRILRGAGEDGLPTLVIGERMVERTPGVTRLIDRMERKGWVTRRRCTSDRRRVWCTISSAGLDLLAELDAPVSAVDRTLLDVLDDSELDTLIGYLDRIRAHVRSLEESSVPPV